MADITLITNQGSIDLSRPTNTDLSGNQYHVVKHDTSEEVVLAGANGKSLGILQNAPDGSSDEAVAVVRIAGVSKLKMDEAGAFGNYLTSSSNSQGEVADAAHEELCAKLLGSADDNDLAAVLVWHGKDSDGNG